MRKCWDEKFEKRPEFSFLVHTMGNMLSDGYKKVSFMFLVSFPWLNNRLQRNSNSDIPQNLFSLSFCGYSPLLRFFLKSHKEKEHAEKCQT